MVRVLLSLVHLATVLVLALAIVGVTVHCLGLMPRLTMTCFMFRFRNLPAKDQANVPCRSAMIIFLHRRSDVDAIAQKLNSDAAKACGCVCYLDCVANEGCRTRGLPRAVVRVHVGYFFWCCCAFFVCCL